MTKNGQNVNLSHYLLVPFVTDAARSIHTSMTTFHKDWKLNNLDSSTTFEDDILTKIVSAWGKIPHWIHRH